MIEIELGTYLINPRWLSLVLGLLLCLSLLVIVVQRVLARRRIADLQEALTKTKLDAGWHYETKGFCRGMLLPPPPPWSPAPSSEDRPS